MSQIYKEAGFKFRASLILFISLVFLSSCDKDPILIVDGLRPIYFSADDFSGIESQPPRTSTHQGAVSLYKDYILVNENLQGVHVFDNSNPANPVKIAFWSIPGNLNFTISDDILYADNGVHLLVIDVSDIYNIKFETHIPDQFGHIQAAELFPIDHHGWFECAKPGRGIVIGWEAARLNDPRCFRD